MDGEGQGAAPPTHHAMHHNQQQVRLLALVWTMTVVAGVFVGLRFYSKISRGKKLWLDDLFLVLAELTLVGTAILCIFSVRNGIGLHPGEIGIDKVVENVLLGCIIGTLTIAGAIWSKTSWALTMLRLTDGWYKAFVWFALISVNVYMGVGALWVWVTCTPIQKSWNPFLPGHCWPAEFFIIWGIVGGSPYNHSSYLSVMEARVADVFPRQLTLEPWTSLCP